MADTLHPFLLDQENLRAFQQLTAAPTGSVRKWEQLLGWKRGRMERFLANLVKYELADIESCRQHSVFRSKVGVADCRGVSRTVAVPNQGNCSGLTKSRFRRPPVERKNTVRHESTADLVQVMNDVLCRNHPLSYLPVRTDNDGSHRAAQLWLVDLEIPLADAIDILRMKAAAFNPSKINGDVPHSLGFFTKSVTAEWRRIQRDRQQLKLFPKLEMHIEPRATEYRPEPAGPAAAPATVAAVMAQLEAEFPKTKRVR